MRISTSILASAMLTSMFFLTPVADAQFDLGDVFRGEARQAIRGIERQIRNEIRNGGGFVQPLPSPVPRPQPLPYPPMPQPVPQPCPQPPVVILPHPPVVSPAPEYPGNGYARPVDPGSGGVITTRKPAQPEPQPLPEVELGEVVSIEGSGFGEEPGAVFIKIDQLILTAELLEWTDELVEAQMPVMPMADSVKATVFVMTATEDIAENMEVTLLPVTENAEPMEAEPESIDVASLPQVTSDEDITLEGSLGSEQGRVELVIGSVRLNATIKQWSDSAATIQLPSINAQEPVAAELIIYDADGQVVEQLQIGFSG